MDLRRLLRKREVTGNPIPTVKQNLNYLHIDPDFKYTCEAMPMRCKWSSNGVAFGLDDGSIVLLKDEFLSNAELESHSVHRAAIFDVEWVDGNCVLSASGDQTVKCFDIDRETVTNEYHGHSGSVRSVNAHPIDQGMI